VCGHHMESASHVLVCLSVIGTCGVHHLGSYTFLFLDIFACMDPFIIL
jgi:hypothetical protein